MKRIFIILFLIYNSVASGNTYYVATNGNNSNPGTITFPWLTWGKAFNTAIAGDTVYFRGGTYPIEVTNGFGLQYDTNGHNGTAANPICYFNYPGETPVLDCANATASNGYNFGIVLNGAAYLHFKGLHIMNINEVNNPPNGGMCYGMYSEFNNHVKYENMVIHDIGGKAFNQGTSHYTEIINCDAYNCNDKYSHAPGGWATGFSNENSASDDCYTYYYGCRAWNCSDQGFSTGGDRGTIIYDHCWAYDNGLNTDGEGFNFKLGYMIINPSDHDPHVIMKYCIGAYGRYGGLTTNDQGYYGQFLYVYNNFFYHNGNYGVFILGPSDNRLRRTFRNNISYDSPNEYTLYETTHSNNSWDSEVTVTNDDFVSLNYSELKQVRKSDGSLPDINFGKLKDGSDLIDAGIDVGLPYVGSAPDMGYSEYLAGFLIPVTGISVSGNAGATTITTDNGTLQLNADITPTNATIKTVTWSITNGTGQASINPTGLVTAISNGTVTARATANDGSGVFGTLVITISNQNILVTGITISGTAGVTSITTDNGTLQLNATISPTNSTNQTVTWSIVNGTGQASINATGLVTAITNGTVTARATANDGSGVFGSLVLMISNQVIPVTAISVSGAAGVTTITTDNGTLQLNATISPTNSTNQTVTWTIVNGTGQASINTTGLVTAITNGTVTARATANDGSGVFGILVLTLSNQSVPVSGITVTGSGGITLITTIGGTLQLSAAIAPSNASNKTVTWSITNGTGQASISTNGLVTAISNGTVTARATATDGSGLSGMIVLTISNQIIPVTSITVTGGSGTSMITINNGTLQLSAVIAPLNATNQTVTWSIAYGTGQASISTTGLVTAITNGTVTARATANDGSGISGILLITISNQIILVTNITISGDEGASTISIDKGTLQLSAVIEPANATNQTVIWSIVNGSGQASIAATGLVSAVQNGTVTARATANDASGSFGTLLITISDQVILVTDIVVSGAGGATTITSENGILQLQATIEPSNATNQMVEWSLFNGTGQASISPTGLLSAVDEGNVLAMASATDESGVHGALEITISFIDPLVIIVKDNEMRILLDESYITGRLDLYNLQGYLIKSNPIENSVCIFNISSLPSGLYLVAVTKQKTLEVGKVIISH